MQAEKWKSFFGEGDHSRGRRYTLGAALTLLAILAVCGCAQKYPPYDIVISHYDPARAFGGNTFFQSHLMNGGMWEVTPEGEVLWEYHHDNFGLGFNILADGNVIAQTGMRPEIIDPRTSTVLWRLTGFDTHHTIMPTPWGTFLSLGNEWLTIPYGPTGNCLFMTDYIVEFNLDPEIVWEWHLTDYLDPVVHHPEGFCDEGAERADWSHCNTVKLILDYTYDGQTYPAVVMLLSRELDTFFLIDHETQEIIWSCGQHGTFGRREPPLEPIFNSAHEIERLANGNFLLYDNGLGRANQLSRALEIAVDPVARTVTEVWSWTDPDRRMFAPWGGDADRLPNGNTMLTDVLYAAIIEVTPAGEKVWQMDVSSPGNWLAYSIYQHKRLPPTP